MTGEELRQLLMEPESETLEFKRSLPQRDQLAALVAAFANTRGGRIVIGAGEGGPATVGLSHPGVVADHAKQWIDESVEPAPRYDIDLVSLEPGRTVVVITVESDSAGPYMGAGRVLERREDRLVPITRQRITERIGPSRQVEELAIERMAAVIATSADRVERLEAQLQWRRQLPLQLGLLVVGAALGYLLGVWNPLGS